MRTPTKETKKMPTADDTMMQETCSPIGHQHPRELCTLREMASSRLPRMALKHHVGAVDVAADQGCKLPNYILRHFRPVSLFLLSFATSHSLHGWWRGCVCVCIRCGGRSPGHFFITQRNNDEGGEYTKDLSKAVVQQVRTVTAMHGQTGPISLNFEFQLACAAKIQRHPRP